MTEQELIATIARLENQVQDLEGKLAARKGNRGKAPTVRNQVIECMKAAKDAPNHAITVAILAKYFAPKKKGEAKEAHEARINALVAEMS